MEVCITSSQQQTTQQQRCPQGFGLIIVGTCSFAIRSVKNFLLRSTFSLQSEKMQVMLPWLCWWPSFFCRYLSAFRAISLATL